MAVFLYVRLCGDRPVFFLGIVEFRAFFVQSGGHDASENAGGTRSGRYINEQDWYFGALVLKYIYVESPEPNKQDRADVPLETLKSKLKARLCTLDDVHSRYYLLYSSFPLPCVFLSYKSYSVSPITSENTSATLEVFHTVL